MRKKLVLKKETLAELSADTLRSVVAASGHTLCLDCINDFSFEVCPVPSLPVEECPLTGPIVVSTGGC